jgi:hypothetical protein
MWQRTGSSTLWKAGVLAAWIVGTRGAPVGSSSLAFSAPGFTAGARGSTSPLTPSGTPALDLVDPPAWGFTGEAALAAVPPPVAAVLASPASELDPVHSSLADPDGAAAALREIQAAASGFLSLDATASPCREPQCPTAQPVSAPVLPDCPAAPAPPDPHALLALVVLPAGFAARSIRRGRRCSTGAVVERFSTAVGLLLIVCWVALRRG